MCDTFQIPANMNVYQSYMLCKNSDREPNEAQAIVHIPSQIHKDSKVKTTYIEIPQVKKTAEVILSKPFQMWGAEMGVNEFGLAIGNEAVFTKFSFSKQNNGLTGMDMIRLALERKTNAKEALEYIIELIEMYGQDACGGYENRNFYYHNSFLIVDKNEAYCLETADRFWVYKKLDGFYSISNGLTIHNDYDNIHPDAIDYAKKRKWFSDGEEFSFARVFSDRFYTYFSQCEVRRNLTRQVASRKQIDIMDCIETLQSHGSRNNSKLDGMKSICLHSGGMTSPSETTGSMIAILRNTFITVWLTGTSHPCLSIYKPFFFGISSFQQYIGIPSKKYDSSLWWQAEWVHRQLLELYSEFKKEYQEEQKEIQQELIELEQALSSQKRISRKEKEEFVQYCVEREKKFLAKWKQTLQNQKYKKKKQFSKIIKRPFYVLYRTHLNRKAKLNFS